MARVNLVTNPRAVGRAFGLAGSTGTQSDVSTGGPLGFGYRRLVLTTTNTTSPITLAPTNTGTSATPVVAGTTYVFMAFARMVGGPTALNAGISVTWYTAAGATLTSDTAYQGGLVDGEWTLHTKVLTAPPTAAFASVTERFSVGAGLMAVGSEYGATGFLIEAASTVGSYFDGSFSVTPDWTYSWSGAVNASTSLEAPTPGLYVVPMLGDPVPRVEITVNGLDAVGPSRVTVWRSTVGGKRRAVRGWKNRLVFGSDFEVDYEAPLGREVQYDLQVISGAVTPLRVTTYAELDVDTGYIQDPLVPASAVPCSSFSGAGLPVPTLAPAAYRKLTYAMESSQAHVLGSDTPVGFAGQRMVASGVDFSVLTDSAEQGSALRNILLTAYPVLVRPLPSWGDLPDLLYLDAPAPTEEPLNGHHGGTVTRWALVGDQVTPPSLSVVVPLWTYDDVQALWASYTYAFQQAAAVAINATYLDDQRDPTLGA